MARIVALGVADAPVQWEHLGFAVENGNCRVGNIVMELGAAGRGVTSWTLDDVGFLAEIPSLQRPDQLAPADVADGPVHPNGVTSLDHLVVTTPDLPRTVTALEAAGIEMRRRRETGPVEAPRIQAFFRLGPTILEVVGPSTPAGPGPARFWGLAFTVADLRATAAWLGPRLLPPIDAVQPGRRIATLDRAAGSSVPMAFLSPHLGKQGPTSLSPGAAEG